MKILVTGAAGFIGFHLIQRLISDGFFVIGIDNINDYYDVNLKLDRLRISGINFNTEYGKLIKSDIYKNYYFYKIDICDRDRLNNIYIEHNFTHVINLAAQAGVRHSINNPDKYIQSNIIGYYNILELSRIYKIKYLIYASSSSVYGTQSEHPFNTNDKVDKPISLYAATKLSNELMSYSYSHLYKINTIGLRFFTVYGPYGRPDMAYFDFTDKIFNNVPIELFNNGNMQRDFTYIDDIIEGILKILHLTLKNNLIGYNIYNLGNNNPIKLKYFISLIEKYCGIVAQKKLKPMQMGDVPITFADIDKSIEDLDYKPMVSIESGLSNFVTWYKFYYNK
jgi:UDP-glucuronate 4-epimerase